MKMKRLCSHAKSRLHQLSSFTLPILSGPGPRATVPKWQRQGYYSHVVAQDSGVGDTSTTGVSVYGG